MICNWQRPEWPGFVYQEAELDVYERQFLQTSGVLRQKLSDYWGIPCNSYT